MGLLFVKLICETKTTSEYVKQKNKSPVLMQTMHRPNHYTLLDKSLYPHFKKTHNLCSITKGEHKVQSVVRGPNVACFQPITTLKCFDWLKMGHIFRSHF